MRYLLKIIFTRPAVWGRGADYSCPLGSLEAAQRDPGVKNCWQLGGFSERKVWGFFLRENKNTFKAFLWIEMFFVHLLELLLLRVVLGVLAQVVLKKRNWVRFLILYFHKIDFWFDILWRHISSSDWKNSYQQRLGLVAQCTMSTFITILWWIVINSQSGKQRFKSKHKHKFGRQK